VNLPAGGTWRIGLPAVLAVAVVARALPPVARWVSALRERAAAEGEAAARARGLVAAEPALRDSLQAALAEVVGLAPLLIEGTTRAEAAASLAAWISSASAQHRLRVRRVESLPDSARGPISRIGVRAELEGDVAGLAGFVRAVEHGTPLLSILEIGIAALDPLSPPSQPEVLRVDVVLGGLFLQRDSP